MTPFAKEHSLELPQPYAHLQPQNLVRQGAAAGVFLIAYVALEWISFIHEYKNVPITPWNPGLGVVFALMVLGGPRYAAVLFAGVIIAETTVLQTSLPLPIVLGVAAIFAFVYGAAAALARKYVRLDAALTHLRDVFILLATGLAGAALAALLLSALLLATGQIGPADVLVAAVPLLVGDIIGIAVMTPLVLRVIRQGRESMIAYSRGRIPEVLLYVVLIAGSLWIDRARPAAMTGSSSSTCCSCRSWWRRCATGSTARASRSPSPSSAWSACCTCSAPTPARSRNSRRSCWCSRRPG